MRESLRGYSLGMIYLAGKSGMERQVADELESFNSLLRSQPGLSDVLSDSSIPSHKRQAILGELLSGKVASPVAGLLEAFVGTESPRVLIESINELARMVHGDDVSGLEGGFATTGRVSGYAQALLESLEGSPELADVEEEIFRFARIVESNVRIRRVLSGIGSEPAQRRGLVEALLRGKVNGFTLEIAAFAASIDRLRDYVEVLDMIATRAAVIRERKIAKVESATALTQEQVNQISSALSRAIGSEVEVRTSINASLIGGVLAVVGDTVFDGSVRNRIEQLRVRLGLPATVKSRERI